MPFDLLLLFFVRLFITSITLSHFLFTPEKEKEEEEETLCIRLCSPWDLKSTLIVWGSHLWSEFKWYLDLLLFGNAQEIHSLDEIFFSFYLKFKWYHDGDIDNSVVLKLGKELYFEIKM